MWQYTTETIINSNVGKLKQIDSATNKLLTGKTDADLVRFYKDTKGIIYIEGVGRFDVANIKGAWKRPYQKAEKAKGELTVNTVANGSVYRLQIWVSEEGTIRPELQNAMLMKSLPFHFEVEAPATGATAAGVADALAKAINKMFVKKGADRLFTATPSGSKVVLEATDCYIRFDEVRLDEVPNTTAGYVDLTGYKNYSPTDAVWTLSKRGTEGNGTVARLVKNLRLPTKASLDPFGADQGGKPVPGGKYDQYMFEYVTDRSHVGHQVFGSVGDQSLTTHVFFVEEGASGDFDKLTTFKSYTAPIDAAAGEGKSAKK